MNELLQKEDNLTETNPNKYKVWESYNNVYLELVKEKELNTIAPTLEGQDGGVVVQEEATESTTENTTPKAGSKAIGDCIWTDDEIKVLRKTFQKLKIQNVYLSGMVDSLQSELQISKEREWKARNSHDILKEKFSELKKRYTRSKISCKSYKEDLKAYHLSLKTTRSEVVDLNFERSVIQKGLNDTKAKLDLEQLKSSQLMTKLDEKENEKVQAIEHCEFVTRQQCKFEETRLRKEIFRLKEELRKERDDNHINKKSLENLRNHFVSSKLNEKQKQTDILNIADVDYT